MQARGIDPFDYAELITKAIPHGVLFTTCADGETNTMVIGWGFLGYVWNRKVFIAYIRETRHSFKLAEQAGDFTVNVPLEGVLDKEIFQVAGRSSGRHVDKMAKLGLTLVDGRQVSAPAIAEVPLTLECKVLYKQMLDADAVPDQVKRSFYPADVTDIEVGGNCYYHMVYYGEVVDSYILED